LRSFSEQAPIPNSSVKFTARPTQEQPADKNTGGLFSNLGSKLGLKEQATATPAANLASLPETHDHKAIKKNRVDAAECTLCFAPFTKKLKVLNRNPQRHCKKCGKAVCEVCSTSKRQLSKTLADKLRVCDKCDFDMDNEELKKNL